MADKIVQCGYMSGDTYSAAALLKLFPATRIILIQDTKGSGAYADKSGTILKIYRETGVHAQVEVLNVSHRSQLWNTTIWDAVKDKYQTGAKVPPKALRLDDEDDEETLLKKALDGLCWRYEPKGKWPRSITAVTGLLANKWREQPRLTERTIAAAWKVGKLPAELKFALYEYMAGKFAKTGFENIRKNILVLWSRQSGKKGGAHLELDSSYEGIRQLAYYFAVESPRATVLLAGDERNGKLAYLGTQNAHVIDVSEMWKGPVWTRLFGEATFLGQFAFFKYLANDYNVIHLGMRSGVLEAMALLGMETFYLEPVSLETGSGKRMVAFQNNGITYRRIQINTPPGLTARIVDQSPKLFSPEIVNSQLSKRARIHKKNPSFQDYFGNNNKAARGFAKMDLLDEPGSYAEIGDLKGLREKMDFLRGFRESDYNAITSLVSAKMV